MPIHGYAVDRRFTHHKAVCELHALGLQNVLARSKNEKEIYAYSGSSKLTTDHNFTTLGTRFHDETATSQYRCAGSALTTYRRTP